MPASSGPVSFLIACVLVAFGCASPSSPGASATRPAASTQQQPAPTSTATLEPTVPSSDSLAATVKALVQDDLGPITSNRKPELRRFYQRRDFRPAWYLDGQWRKDADSLVAVLNRADRHGLIPADYQAAALARRLPEAAASSPTPPSIARLDVRLTAAALDYASDLYNGRIAPAAVDPDWYVPDDTINAAQALLQGLDEGDLPERLRQTTPDHAGYERLRSALTTYREIAEEGGWPEVPEGDVLHPGDTSARVPVLRKRLAMTDDLSLLEAAELDSAYDAALAEALYRFQHRHSLTTDSLLGPSTREVLNVPVEERIRQIKLNLERWRWLPDDLGQRYVLVNIPNFQLKAYRDGDVAEAMGVIAGKAYNDRATPIFADSMAYVIFRPFWNIPPGIANEEILPKARGNRDYLVENNYQIVSHYGPGAEVYDPYATSLARVASGELRLREKAGPTNALGLVKFMFPNQYAVYLHDTPADHLFSETERDFSHGCVRVERPKDLAVFALAQKPEWTPQRIDEAMHQSSWERIDLDTPIPVYLAYWTAFVDQDGTVHFREDLYDHDGALDQALRQAAARTST